MSSTKNAGKRRFITRQHTSDTSEADTLSVRTPDEDGERRTMENINLLKSTPSAFVRVRPVSSSAEHIGIRDGLSTKQLPQQSALTPERIEKDDQCHLVSENITPKTLQPLAICAPLTSFGFLPESETSSIGFRPIRRDSIGSESSSLAGSTVDSELTASTLLYDPQNESPQNIIKPPRHPSNVKDSTDLTSKLRPWSYYDGSNGGTLAPRNVLSSTGSASSYDNLDKTDSTAPNVRRKNSLKTNSDLTQKRVSSSREKYLERDDRMGSPSPQFKMMTVGKQNNGPLRSISKEKTYHAESGQMYVNKTGDLSKDEGVNFLDGVCRRRMAGGHLQVVPPLLVGVFDPSRLCPHSSAHVESEPHTSHSIVPGLTKNNEIVGVARDPNFYGPVGRHAMVSCTPTTSSASTESFSPEFARGHLNYEPCLPYSNGPPSTSSSSFPTKEWNSKVSTHHNNSTSSLPMRRKFAQKPHKMDDSSTVAADINISDQYLYTTALQPRKGNGKEQGLSSVAELCHFDCFRGTGSPNAPVIQNALKEDVKVSQPSATKINMLPGDNHSKSFALTGGTEREQLPTSKNSPKLLSTLRNSPKTEIISSFKSSPKHEQTSTSDGSPKWKPKFGSPVKREQMSPSKISPKRELSAASKASQKFEQRFTPQNSPNWKPSVTTIAYNNKTKPFGFSVKNKTSNFENMVQNQSVTENCPQHVFPSKSRFKDSVKAQDVSSGVSAQTKYTTDSDTKSKLRDSSNVVVNSSKVSPAKLFSMPSVGLCVRKSDQHSRKNFASLTGKDLRPFVKTGQTAVLGFIKDDVTGHDDSASLCKAADSGQPVRNGINLNVKDPKITFCKDDSNNDIASRNTDIFSCGLFGTTGVKVSVNVTESSLKEQVKSNVQNIDHQESGSTGAVVNKTDTTENTITSDDEIEGVAVNGVGTSKSSAGVKDFGNFNIGESAGSANSTKKIADAAEADVGIYAPRTKTFTDISENIKIITSAQHPLSDANFSVNVTSAVAPNPLISSSVHPLEPSVKESDNSVITTMKLSSSSSDDVEKLSDKNHKSKNKTCTSSDNDVSSENVEMTIVKKDDKDASSPAFVRCISEKGDSPAVDTLRDKCEPPKSAHLQSSVESTVVPVGVLGEQDKKTDVESKLLNLSEQIVSSSITENVLTTTVDDHDDDDDDDDNDDDDEDAFLPCQTTDIVISPLSPSQVPLSPTSKHDNHPNLRNLQKCMTDSSAALPDSHTLSDETVNSLSEKFSAFEKCGSDEITDPQRQTSSNNLQEKPSDNDSTSTSKSDDVTKSLHPVSLDKSNIQSDHSNDNQTSNTEKTATNTPSIDPTSSTKFLLADSSKSTQSTEIFDRSPECVKLSTHSEALVQHNAAFNSIDFLLSPNVSRSTDANSCKYFKKQPCTIDNKVNASVFAPEVSPVMAALDDALAVLTSVVMENKKPEIVVRRAATFDQRRRKEILQDEIEKEIFSLQSMNKSDDWKNTLKNSSSISIRKKIDDDHKCFTRKQETSEPIVHNLNPSEVAEMARQEIETVENRRLRFLKEDSFNRPDSPMFHETLPLPKDSIIKRNREHRKNMSSSSENDDSPQTSPRTAPKHLRRNKRCHNANKATTIDGISTHRSGIGSSAASKTLSRHQSDVFLERLILSPQKSRRHNSDAGNSTLKASWSKTTGLFEGSHPTTASKDDKKRTVLRTSEVQHSVLLDNNNHDIAAVGGRRERNRMNRLESR